MCCSKCGLKTYDMKPSVLGAGMEEEKSFSDYGDWLSHEDACKIIAALNRSAFDIAPCQLCNEDVVCIPEGGAICEKCAGKE